jgi:hypothetical protein
MSIKTYITTVDSSEIYNLNTEEGETLITLGHQEDAVAVQLQELLSSVTDAIADSLDTEGKLTIEITGSVNLKAQGGVKYLIFNAGVETGKTMGMKIVFSTTLQPKSYLKG